MNKSKGFTIIELIVVIAIIAILAAIVMVNVTQYIAKSKDASIQADLHTILVDGIAATASIPSTLIGTTISSNSAWTQITTTQSGTGKTLQNVDTTTGKFCACANSITSSSTWFCADNTSGTINTLTGTNPCGSCAASASPSCGCTATGGTSGTAAGCCSGAYSSGTTCS